MDFRKGPSLMSVFTVENTSICLICACKLIVSICTDPKQAYCTGLI